MASLLQELGENASPDLGAIHWLYVAAVVLKNALRTATGAAVTPNNPIAPSPAK